MKTRNKETRDFKIFFAFSYFRAFVMNLFLAPACWDSANKYHPRPAFFKCFPDTFKTVLGELIQKV